MDALVAYSNPFEPEAGDEDWDIVIIGAGMGGTTLGYSLAKRGHRVLFLEKGLFVTELGAARKTEPSSEPENEEMRLKQGRWPVRIDGTTSFDTGLSFYAPLGCGTGGSTNLYAAQLERMHPSDFEPRRQHPLAVDTTLPEEWPYAYSDLAPYYRAAESLFEVRGSEDPLNPDPLGSLKSAPPLSDRDQGIFDSFRRVGLNPYRAHVGCRFIPGCSGCAATICKRDCKRDAGVTCLVPALRDHGAKIITGAEVTRLEAASDRVNRVVFRLSNQERHVRGRVVVLAAGALMTPVLLLRSTSAKWPNGLGNRSGMVGRNLMMHTSDFLAIRPTRRLSPDGPHKGISLNDFYVRDGVKMGNLQSAGMRISVGLISRFLKSRTERERLWYLRGGAVVRRIAAEIGYALYRSANIFATVVEDLPYLDNRVEVSSTTRSGMRFFYNYRDELRFRNANFHEQLQKSVHGELGVWPIRAGYNNLNLGHLSGTCRAGNDPERSVLNRDNRFHDLENLYVADSSSFPSSGGINPSLTIAARAMQVADSIHLLLGADTTDLASSQ